MDLLFPELMVAANQCLKVNLDEAFRKRTGPPLDMTNPDDQQRLIKEVSGDKLSCGGFMEDRSAIWKGFESGRHLGVDFNNLRPGEAVGSLTTGTVTHVIKDDTKQNGWGTRIIVLSDADTYMLYGHLAKPRVVVGDRVLPGQVLGEIAPPETNGGWFPHLHLQMMDKNLLKVPVDHVNLGYEDKENQGAGMIDPMELVDAWEKDRVRTRTIQTRFKTITTLSDKERRVAISAFLAAKGLVSIRFCDGKWENLEIEWRTDDVVHLARNKTWPGEDWVMCFKSDDEYGRMYSLTRGDVTIQFPCAGKQ